MEEKRIITGIDLFSGCGGLSLGFEQNGYLITKAVEYDESIASTYKTNYPNVNMIVDDIRNIDDSRIFEKNDADVIIGGPPCQGFSMAGARIRNGFIDDPRNYLFKHYYNIVKTVRPKVFVFENVKGILTMHNGDIFKQILEIFGDAESFDGKPYKLFYKVVKGVDFGIPQKRERVILLGTTLDGISFENLWNITKNEISAEIPGYFDKVTVRDAIGNMPAPTEDGWIDNPKPYTAYQEFLASDKPKIGNHVMTKHSTVAIERMQKVKSGENFTALDEQINSVHSGSYGRLCWDEPAATITTRFDTPAGGRFIHPEENRTLTPREAARIQSFPDDFEFTGNRTSVCKQIGNAVPPKISYFIARLVKNIIGRDL